MSNTFANTIQLLIHSTTKAEFKGAIETLKAGVIDTTIPSSETHVAADLVNALGIKIMKGEVDGIIGLKEKADALSLILNQLGSYDLNDSPGSHRLFSACQHILDLSKSPSCTEVFEKSPKFVVSAIEEFSDILDGLMNSKSMLEVTNHSRALVALAPKLDKDSTTLALSKVRNNSTAFIQAVNDPTSSFSQLNEAVASEIVRAVSMAENTLVYMPSSKVATTGYLTVESSSPVTVQGDIKIEEAIGEQEADPPAVYKFKTVFPHLVSHLKTLRAGSKEYNAKIKFFTAYVQTLPNEHVLDVYQDASYLVLGGDEHTTTMINKLMSIA